MSTQLNSPRESASDFLAQHSPILRVHCLEGEAYLARRSLHSMALEA